MPLVHLRPVALPLATLLALLGATPAAADDDTPADLGITPVSHDGSWFDLELEPGEQVDLEVEVANHGGQAVEARSYVADVYSLINGGMGVGLRGATTDAAVTGWIDYPSSTTMLEPDAALRHTVTVAVPDDVQPGRYITALVVEHLADDPRDDAGDDEADRVDIDQVVRQAVAVDISVPGDIAAQLELGGTHHLLTDDRSTLRTELDNPGNWHLVPTGGLELVGPDGRRVAEQDLELGIVYADTRTHVEALLDQRLDPGTYTITTTLTDLGHDVEVTHTSTFEVAAPPPASAVRGLDRVIDTLDASGPGLRGVALLALGLLCVGLLIAAARRRRPRPTVQPPPPPTVASRPTAPRSPPLIPAPIGHGTMAPPTPATWSEPARPRPSTRSQLLPSDTSLFTARAPRRADQRR